ncbi:hypothetical protein ACO0SA_001559 [Hanseniaspora valbyensis]
MSENNSTKDDSSDSNIGNSVDKNNCKNLFQKIVTKNNNDQSKDNYLDVEVDQTQFKEFIQDSNKLFQFVATNNVKFNNEHKQISENKNLMNNISANYMNELFNTISNGKNTFNYTDFENYYTTTIKEIQNGFHKIDLDQDGLVKLNDVNKYLTNLSIVNKTKNIESNNNNNTTNYKPIFLQWAMTKKTSGKDGQLRNGLETDKDYKIGYKDWENFLIFVPRHNNSRLETAFKIYSNVSTFTNTDILNRFKMDEELDLDQLTSEFGDLPKKKKLSLKENKNLKDKDLIEKEQNFVKTNEDKNQEFVEEQENEHKEGVKQHFNTNSLKYFLAGGTAGVISRTCTAPFDRIKVFLIANDRTLHVSDVLRTIYKKAGLKGFYVGNGLSALKIFPESAIKFGSFELVKKIIFPHSYNNMKENPLGNYLCGGIAGCMAQLFVYPIDTIKYRMQCENVRFASYNSPQHSNLKKIVTEAYKQHGGIKAFYRGLPAGLAGMFPYAAIDLGTFNLLKNIASQYYFPEEYNDNEQLQQQHLPNMVLLPLGAISGSIGASVVYPVNLLRTRLQAQGTFAHPHRYNGFFDCCAKTVTREGVKGLYKGLLPNLVKVCPSVAISYFCYENFKRLLDLKN